MVNIRFSAKNIPIQPVEGFDDDGMLENGCATDSCCKVAGYLIQYLIQFNSYVPYISYTISVEQHSGTTGASQRKVVSVRFSVKEG